MMKGKDTRDWGIPPREYKEKMEAARYLSIPCCPGSRDPIVCPWHRLVYFLSTNYKKNDDHWIACWMRENDGCVDALQVEEVKILYVNWGAALCLGRLLWNIQLLHLDQDCVEHLIRNLAEVHSTTLGNDKRISC